MNFQAVPFIQSLSLQRKLFCVLLEGLSFQSFLSRMLKGKYKMETIKKHQRMLQKDVSCGHMCNPNVPSSFYGKNWFYGMPSHIFKVHFLQHSFNQTKSSLLQRTWRCCQKALFFSQVTISFSLIFVERFLQELLVSVIFSAQLRVSKQLSCYISMLLICKLKDQRNHMECNHQNMNILLVLIGHTLTGKLIV